MAAQTTYGFYQSVPYAGALYDLESDQQIRSYANQEATASMPFGIAVAQGANDDGCILMVDTNSKVLGITIHTHAVDPHQVATTPAKAGLSPKGTCGVLRQGRLWAIAEAIVAPQDDVFARYTASTAPKDQLGGLGPSADSSSAKQIAQAKWLTTAAAAGLAVVDINMP